MMDKFFKSEWAIRILSLALAIFLWVFIVVMLNPEMEITIRDIPVTYYQESVLTDNNLAIVNERAETVDVKLSARRNLLTDINNKNILASVDLSKCGAGGTYTLPIQINLPFDGISVVDKTPYNASILVDSVVTKEFRVSAMQSGNVKDGCEVLSVVLEPDSVRVTGTTQKINEIEKAIVTVDVNHTDLGVTTEPEIKLLNASGDEVSTDGLSLSAQQVKATTSVLQKKTVPVNVVVTGGNANTTIKENSRVEILGSKELLNEISSIDTIPVDVSSLDETTVLKVDLELPENIAMKEKVQVTVKINKLP